MRPWCRWPSWSAPVSDEGRSYGVVVTRDSCGAEAFRRLKVFLRWRLRPDAAGPDADTPSDR